MSANAKADAANARRPYKVFVSSTYLDNKARRRLVQAAITMAGMVWHGMEIFPAGTHTTVEECRRFVKEADVLVGIIAWRYGWEPEGGKKEGERLRSWEGEKMEFGMRNGEAGMLKSEAGMGRVEKK